MSGTDKDPDTHDPVIDGPFEDRPLSYEDQLSVDAFADAWGHDNKETVKLSLPARITGLLEALAIAFGGRSQFGSREAGKALCGQWRNQGWNALGFSVEDAVAELGRQLDEYWDNDEPASESRIYTAFMAAGGGQ